MAEGSWTSFLDMWMQQWRDSELDHHTCDATSLCQQPKVCSMLLLCVFLIWSAQTNIITAAFPDPKQSVSKNHHQAMPLEQLLGPGNINKLQIWHLWGTNPTAACVCFWSDLPKPTSSQLLFLIQNKVFQRTITKPCHWNSCLALGTSTSCRFDLTRMLLHN